MKYFIPWRHQKTFGTLQHAFCIMLYYKKHLGEFELEENEFINKRVK